MYSLLHSKHTWMEGFCDYFAVALLMRLVAISCVLRERVAACNVRKIRRGKPYHADSWIKLQLNLTMPKLSRCEQKSQSYHCSSFFSLLKLIPRLQTYCRPQKYIERANNDGCSQNLVLVIFTLIIQGADLRNGKPALTSCRHIVIMQADCKINI